MSSEDLNKSGNNARFTYIYWRYTWWKPSKFFLKVQLLLYNNKYMAASTQRVNTEIFAFLAVVVYSKVISKQKRQSKLLKSRLLFTKMANFRGKLLEIYK